MTGRQTLSSGSEATPGSDTEVDAASRRFASLGRRLAVSYGLLATLLVLWQVIAIGVGSPFFPPPLMILERFWEMFLLDPQGRVLTTNFMVQDALPTLGRAASGWILGSLVGVALGFATGLSQAFGATTSWVVEFLRAIPSTATLPLFILILGGESGMRIAFIAFGISWYVLINTAAGVRSIDPSMLRMARAYRKSRREQILTIVLPASTPHIFASLRLATAGALILAIASEFLVSANGVGYQLLLTQATLRMVDLWAWIVFLALAGLLINVLLEALEKRILAWHRASHA